MNAYIYIYTLATKIIFFKTNNNTLSTQKGHIVCIVFRATPDNYADSMDQLHNYEAEKKKVNNSHDLERLKYDFKSKLDDSAFFRTQSYITKICYFEYLLSLLFGWQKPYDFSPQFRAI